MTAAADIRARKKGKKKVDYERGRGLEIVQQAVD